MVIRRLRLRGLSLMSALFLVAVVLTLATMMVAIYSTNLNVTQRSYNGTVALAEAEAGIAEALYRMTREENVDNAAQPPTVSFGRNSEEIRATITPGMREDEAFHIVTFNRSSEYPYSTNNTFLDSDEGSLGRTVPDGTFHLVSTGYCRGQYRTIECVVKKPPFPFGLATSGKIESPDPLVVRGVSTIQTLIDGEEDRPGHILCNSAEGVVIGARPPNETFISGFVKAVGSINVAQPAVVLGGLRPDSDTSTLADIDIEAFKNEGQPGVVRLLDDTYSESQEMDVMYYYEGDTLTYQRNVQLNQAFLYVQGDLVVRGALTGEGLIVVNGDARFESGTVLSGANKMAILASGDITLIGDNNFFTGLVYCEGNLNASNVTIVGNTVVNSSNPSEGKAELENVGIVSNEETADMTIIITSSSKAGGQNNSGDGFPLLVNPPAFGYDGSEGDLGGLQGWLMPGDTPAKFQGQLVAQIWDVAVSGGEFPEFRQPTPVPPGTEGLWDQARALYELAEPIADLQAEIKTLNAAITELQTQVPVDQDAINNLLTDIGEKQLEIDALVAANASDFADAETELIAAVFEHKASFTSATGSLDDTFADMDITREERFNLNEYLPESEKVKFTFWRVHNQRF